VIQQKALGTAYDQTFHGDNLKCILNDGAEFEQEQPLRRGYY
jgi:hypothetical protein